MGELDLKGVTAAVAGDPLESALTAHRQRTTWEIGAHSPDVTGE